MSSVSTKRVGDDEALRVSSCDVATIESIPVEQIDFDNTEFCFRISVSLHNLKEDIQKNGQQFPVVLRNQKTTRLYQIISGFRRCICLREIGATRVSAVIRNDLTDDEAYYLSYAENDKRKNLSGMDKAHAIAKLAGRGKTPGEIQLLYGIGERQFYRLKKASEFPREIRDAVVDRFIHLTHGLVLTEAYELLGSKLDLDEWIDWIVEREASVNSLKHAIKKRYRADNRASSSLVKTRDGGFRLFGIRFVPNRMDSTTARAIHESILQAKVLIDDWLQNHPD